MNIIEETYSVLGQRLLNEFDSKKLVEWAVNLMISGYDSESLAILAGLDYESTEVREEYFWKSIKELNLDIKRDEQELINAYAKYVANAVLNKQLSPKSGLKKMNDIGRSTGYDLKYIRFYDIEEELDFIFYEGQPSLDNQGLTLENADQFIIKEFEIFLEYEDLEIEKAIQEKAFCNTCGQITKPELRRKFQFKRPFRYIELVCRNCKSNKIDSFSSRKGKEKILQQLKATYNTRKDK